MTSVSAAGFTVNSVASHSLTPRGGKAGNEWLEIRPMTTVKQPNRRPAGRQVGGPGVSSGDRSVAALKAWRTRRAVSAFAKSRASEAASKEAFRLHCEQHGWKLAFFEGATGSPRTGIIDAIAFRLGRGNSDLLDIRLVQLKGGKAGVTGAEIGRLKNAVAGVTIDWLIAAFDGDALHIVPKDLTVDRKRSSKRR